MIWGNQLEGHWCSPSTGHCQLMFHASSLKSLCTYPSFLNAMMCSSLFYLRTLAGEACSDEEMIPSALRTNRKFYWLGKMAYIYYFSERFSKPKVATLGYLQNTCNKLYLKMEEEGGSIWKYNFGANHSFIQM